MIDSRCLSAWPTGFSVLAQHNDSTISQQCHASDICVGSTPVDAVFLWVVFFLRESLPADFGMMAVYLWVLFGFLQIHNVDAIPVLHLSLVAGQFWNR